MSSVLQSSLSSSSTLASPSSTSSDSSNSSGGSSGDPSSLYLFTFLATLLLLLFVSGAIVLRSFIVRRRFRRRIEEALAAGVLLTPPFEPLFPQRRLEKPILWDAALTPASDEEWRDLLPIGAKITNVQPSITEGGSPSAREQEDAQSQWSSLGILRRPFARRRATSSSLLIPPDPPPPQLLSGTSMTSISSTEDMLAHATELQVSLLVAMPNPHRPTYIPEAKDQSISAKGKKRSISSYWDEDEEGVPDVALGISRVLCRGSGWH